VPVLDLNQVCSLGGSTEAKKAPRRDTRTISPSNTEPIVRTATLLHPFSIRGAQIMSPAEQDRNASTTHKRFARSSSMKIR
jgi:hypothetical protein